MTGADNVEVQQNMIKNNHLGIASHSNSGSKITSNLISGNQLAGITFVNTKSSKYGYEQYTWKSRWGVPR